MRRVHPALWICAFGAAILFVVLFLTSCYQRQYRIQLARYQECSPDTKQEREAFTLRCLEVALANTPNTLSAVENPEFFDACETSAKQKFCETRYGYYLAANRGNDVWTRITTVRPCGKADTAESKRLCAKAWAIDSE